MHIYKHIQQVWKLAVISCVLLMALSGIVVPIYLQAQVPTTTLKLAVSDFNKAVFDQRLIDDFEAANPGTKVELTGAPSTIPPYATDPAKYFDAIQQYAQSADVLYVDARFVTPEATSAGLFLDLAPLVNTDKNFDSSDFYPSVWQAFQWDQGIWALPAAASVIVMSYQPSAFDKAGLTYPSADWTMTDLDKAVRKLAVKECEWEGNYGGDRRLQGLQRPGAYPQSPGRRAIRCEYSSQPAHFFSKYQVARTIDHRSRSLIKKDTSVIASTKHR